MQRVLIPADPLQAFFDLGDALERKFLELCLGGFCELKGVASGRLGPFQNSPTFPHRGQ